MAEQRAFHFLVVGEKCVNDGLELLNELKTTAHDVEYISSGSFNEQHDQIDLTGFNVIILLGQEENIDILTAMRFLELSVMWNIPLLVIIERKSEDACGLRNTNEENWQLQTSLGGSFHELIFESDYNWLNWTRVVIKAAENVISGDEPLRIKNVEPVPKRDKKVMTGG